MANWGKILSRGNVEDRRSMAPAIGGIGLTGFALLFLFNMLLGGNPEDVLGQLDSVPVENQQYSNNSEFKGEDSYEIFASTVLGSNNDMWTKVFSHMNQKYIPPKLVLFRVAAQVWMWNLHFDYWTTLLSA